MKLQRLCVFGIVAVFALGVVFVPAAAADQQISVNPGSLTSHECNTEEWHFVITQIDDESDAPATIHVEWANGASEDVPLDNFTGGTAHYRTTSNLDSTVTSATAEIYDAWSGTFNVSHGPCETPTTTTTPETTTTTEPQATPEAVVVQPRLTG